MKLLSTISALLLCSANALAAQTPPHETDFVMVNPPASATLKPFHIGRTEVTWAQYLLAVKAVQCPLPANQSSQSVPNAMELADDYAVTGLTVVAVECYIRWISNSNGHKYRLPRSEEWLYLAKRAYQANGINKLGELDRLPAPDETRQAVRGGAVLPAIHGIASPDGLYGLLDSAGEMVDQTEPGTPAECAAYGVTSCRKQFVYGMNVGFTKTPFFERGHFIDVYINRYIGFRLAYDD